MKVTNSQKGFTLIELLVAMVVFAFLMLTSFQLFNSVLDANERSETQFKQENKFNFAWSIIFQDIIHIRPRPHRDIQGTKQSAYATSQEYLAEFIRAGLPPIEGVTPGGMQHIAYLFEEEKLYRLSWQALDLANDSEPVKQLLIDGLKDIKIEHLDSSNEWNEDWPPLALSNPSLSLLPHMFRISLTLNDGRELSRLFPGVSQ